DAVHGVPGHQLAILQRIGVPAKSPSQVLEADINSAEQLIDALIGYSLKDAPTGYIASLISAANTSGRPIAALDIPSGLPGRPAPRCQHPARTRCSRARQPALRRPRLTQS